MKILHLVGGELAGGAARGALWLHGGLLDLGVNSLVVTNGTPVEGVPGVVSTVSELPGRVLNSARVALDAWVVNRHRGISPHHFSTGLFGVDITKLPGYQGCDVVHLHWVNHSFVDIRTLSSVKRPIVWTLRDMWPLTGGCHYSLDCRAYENRCGNCPLLLKPTKADLSYRVLEQKRRAIPKKAKIVAISNWLAEKARNSAVFRDHEVLVIPNGINTSTFFPVSKAAARLALGIETGKRILLTGSLDAGQPYKGMSRFVSAVKELNSADYLICVFGKSSRLSQELPGFEVREFGTVRDDALLRVIYSSADVFVAPSLAEAFGKTLVEAMACGTPVACFDEGGPKDIVRHKIDGYRASLHEKGDLTNGIEWIIANNRSLNLSAQARERTVDHFDVSTVARSYSTVYEELLKS